MKFKDSTGETWDLTIVKLKKDERDLKLELEDLMNWLCEQDDTPRFVFETVWKIYSKHMQKLYGDLIDEYAINFNSKKENKK